MIDKLMDKLADLIVDSTEWVIYQSKMLKHRPRLWWNKLYIREDEFDKSLNLNGYAMLSMNKEDRKKHLSDLCKRRQIAHDRDIEQKDKKNAKS